MLKLADSHGAVEGRGLLDANLHLEAGELPALVDQVKSGFEAMVQALTDYRERLRLLEAEVQCIRHHCEGQCPLGYCPLETKSEC